MIWNNKKKHMDHSVFDSQNLERNMVSDILDEVEDASSKSWTKEELTIHKNGYAAMAAAVIRQWILDGKPQDSIDTILLWAAILKQYLQEDKV